MYRTMWYLNLYHHSLNLHYDENVNILYSDFFSQDTFWVGPHKLIKTTTLRDTLLQKNRDYWWTVPNDVDFCTGCPRRNGQNFGRVFLMLNYTDITQNTYIQSWTVKEIMAIEKCGLLGCPRTVRRPWCHTCPLCMPSNETPLANIIMQWPWRDNRAAAACVNYLET